MARCYPVSLLMEGRLCLVVGGGRVAERKVEALLVAGARVRVVSPKATERIAKLAESGAIALDLREPLPGDLDGAALVILATDDAELNARLSGACRERGLLVNVVDAPELCSFYVPATVTRGPICIAISTEGASPALAGHLRGIIEDVVGEEYGALAGLMGELRHEVKARFPRQSERAEAWREVIQSDVLDLLRQGRADEARRLARKVLGLPPEDGP